MKQILIAILTVFCLINAMPALAVTKAKSSDKVESLKYDAYYHKGFIWIKAGSGVLTQWDEQTDDGKNRKHAQLCGRTLSIAESLMKVRDTLECWYNPDVLPIEYVKKTNEGSYQAIERNYYHIFDDGNLKEISDGLDPAVIDSTKIDVYRWRNKKGNDRKTIVNGGEAYDMLTIFYKIRSLDFDNMAAGTKLKYYIVSGIKGRWMNVHYMGKTTCTLRSGKQYPAHRIELTFQSKDSDSTPLQVWLAQSPDHRPLSVIIQLKRIGSIQGEIVE
ncbi:MAG: DUF3108 domain-containing protein [Bacteroidales bacterium]|nr:DUF3108 domain-containing protein [Candidatus Liminaster caballi]